MMQPCFAKTLRIQLNVLLLVINVFVVNVGSLPLKLPADVTIQTINNTLLERLSWTYHVNSGIISHDNTSSHVIGTCKVRPTDNGIHEFVQNALETNSKLIEYKLTIKGYNPNPLEVNNTWYYKPHTWARVASAQGQTILNLAFNYGILSLQTLTFGIEKVNVELEDVPKDCFGQLDEDEQMISVMDIIMRDLDVNKDITIFEGQSSVCHQYIHEVDGKARFTDRCCYEARGSKDIKCVVDIPNSWLSALNVFLGLMLIGVFMFGPTMMPDWVYTIGCDKMDYYVRLKEPLYKKLAIIRREGQYKVTDIKYDERHVLDLRNRRDFSECRSIISTLPHDYIIPIKISQFDIKVNYKKLLVENSVPVGILDTLFHAVFLCKMSELEAFQGCCDANLAGDRDCLSRQKQGCNAISKLKKICCCASERYKRSKLHRRYKHICGCNILERQKHLCRCLAKQRWITLCNIFGRILLILCILIPFYIRLAVYYIYEDPEITARRKAAANVDLDVHHNYRLMQYLTPTHPLYIIIYVIYMVAGMTVAILSGTDRKTRFQQTTMDAFADMNNLSMLKAFEMLVINCLWPFKKFGCYGILIGLILWPLLLPISTIVCSIYCLPLVFLTCRIVWYTFRGHKLPQTQKEYKKDIPLSQRFRADHVMKTIKSQKMKRVDRERYCYYSFYCSFLLNVVLALMVIITLYSTMLMLAEIVTFIAEIVCFTMMGIIVNASTVLKYGTLFLLVVIYCYDCYSSVNKTYLKLNKAIYKCIKDRLGRDIKEYTELPQDKQGFRGFKAQEASEQASFEEPDSLDKKPFHWRINDLIMFVDKDDTPRIPKKLFEKVCQIEAAGAPGPVYRSLLKATKKLFILILFLMLVFIIVMSFGDSYKVSSTNQMLATMAGGFMPFMFKNIFKPNRPDVEADLLSFRAKLDEIIEGYIEVWPMTEFLFDIEEPPKPKEETEEQKDDGVPGGNVASGKSGGGGGGGDKGKPDKDKKKKKDEEWMKSVQRIEAVNREQLSEQVHAIELQPAEGNEVDILVFVNEADQDWDYEESIADYEAPVSQLQMDNKNSDAYHVDCDLESVHSFKSHDFM